MRGGAVSLNEVDNDNWCSSINSNLLNANSLTNDRIDFKLKDLFFADEIFATNEQKNFKILNFDTESIEDKIKRYSKSFSTTYQEKKLGRIEIFNILAEASMIFLLIFSLSQAEFVCKFFFDCNFSCILL